MLASALNQLAARLAADDPALSAALRQQQDLQERQNRLRAELGAESRKGEKQRSAEREAPKPKGRGGFLAVAAPLFARPGFAGTLERGNPCGAQFDARALVASLSPLPETAEEARALAAAWSPKRHRLLLGEAANKAALRKALGDKPAIVAFATHGLLPEDLFCDNEPALALSPQAASTAAEDGLLRASEIIGLPLEAELVILSACNTAGADGRLGGESFSGLTRAFFHAGARNVLATHWPIDSRATVALMKALAKAREKGAAWPEALRESKRQLADQPQTAHPFYWRAFSLVGGG